jgi:hypothetical protein
MNSSAKRGDETLIRRMAPPPLLTGACLAFWGWQTGHPVLALFCALVIESASVSRSRLDLKDKDFARTADFCTLLLAGTAVWAATTVPFPDSLFTIATLLPLAFFPLAAVFRHSTARALDALVLLRVLGRKAGRPPGTGALEINPVYVFCFLCVFSASVANTRSPWFYPSLFALVVWGLAPARSKRTPFPVWMLLVCVAGALGYAGQSGLNRLQIYLDASGFFWFDRLLDAERDPYRNLTAIGEVGALKQNGRILFRVKPIKGRGIPLLLREASYDSYGPSTWFASGAAFSHAAPPDDPMGEWKLDPRAKADSLLLVARPLKDGQGLLPLPSGAASLTRLPAASVMQNRLGAVKVEGGPGLAVFQAHYRMDRALADPPTERDSVVPEVEAAAVTKLCKELSLVSLSPRETVERLRRFFLENFTYSLVLGKPGRNLSALEDFLYHHRTGHCEYFATATVLLLRAAGVPARYVTGYSASEFSPLGGWMVVRQRHAHAWAMAHVDGHWYEVDTTPPSWIETEERAAPLWEIVQDTLSFFQHALGQIRWGTRTEEGVGRFIPWLLPPVLFAAVFRLLAKRKKSEGKGFTAPEEHRPAPPGQGMDSPLFLLEQDLAGQGVVRLPGETFHVFFSRLARERVLSFEEAEETRRLVGHHYRFRYDPLGLSREEQADFQAGVEKQRAALKTALGREDRALDSVCHKSVPIDEPVGYTCASRRPPRPT